MTPEQQRIAIAEACGWTDCVFNPARGQHPMGCFTNEKFLGLSTLPDYLSDLNAMHEAEKFLSPEQARIYSLELERTGVYWMWHIPASQRAEAFLRTVGKWKD